MGKTPYLHSEVAIVAGWFAQSFLLLFYSLKSFFMTSVILKKNQI